VHRKPHRNRRTRRPAPRESLISLEVGLSAALLILAGLLTGSLIRLLNVNKGVDASRVLTVNFSLSAEPPTGKGSLTVFSRKPAPSPGSKPPD
jgi:hypothetical protein